MLSAFLNILFVVLVNKTHEISRDDVVVAIYDMAAVDFDGFYRAVSTSRRPLFLRISQPRC